MRIAGCRRSTFSVALLLVGTCLGSAAADDAPRKGLYQRTLRSTALIEAGPNRGTGWVANVPRRLLITNSHVVGNQDAVLVTFPMYENGRLVAERSAYRNGSQRVRGSVLDVDPRRDLALIEVEALPATVTALAFAKEPPSPGDSVHSVGNPASSDALWVYTSGTVRQVYRKKFLVDGQPVDARVVETQSPINPGDSGGPVLNDSGEVVGVTSAMNRSAQLVSLCIEISEVREFLEAATRVTTPKTATDFNRRGEQWLNKGRHDRAIADFTQAIQLDPDLAVAYANRALGFQNKNDLITALADFDTAIRLKADYGPAYRGRAFAYLRRGDFDRTITDASEAIKLNERDAIAYNLRGVARVNKRAYDAAQRDFSDAIRIDPNYATAFYNRGDTCNVLGNFDKALENFTEAIRINPSMAIAHRDRGLAYRLKGDYDLALADYNRALLLDPRNAIALRDRGMVHKVKGNYDQTIADCIQSIKLNPKDPITYNLRGAAYSFKNDWQKAIADYSQAIKLNPRYAVAFKNRGLAYQATGNESRAKADLEEAARLDPSLKPAPTKGGEKK